MHTRTYKDLTVMRWMFCSASDQTFAPHICLLTFTFLENIYGCHFDKVITHISLRKQWVFVQASRIM